MSSVDPDYVSGGGGGVGGGVDPDYVSGGGGEVGGVEKKVLAVFEREFAVAIQQKEEELATIDERIFEVRRLMEVVRRGSVNNYYGPAQVTQSATRPTVSFHPAIKREFVGKRPRVVEESMKEEEDMVESMKEEDMVEVKQDEEEDKDSMIMDQDKLQGGTKRELERNSEEEEAGEVVKRPRYVGPRKAETPYDVPVPRGGGICRYKQELVVGNVSKWLEEGEGMATHKWMLYVRGGKDKPDLSDVVSRVQVELHPSYSPHHLVEISTSPFHLTRRGWGEFPLKLKIHFRHPEDRPLAMEHQLKLDKTYTGLQTLGAESCVEVWLHREPQSGDRPAEELFEKDEDLGGWVIRHTDESNLRTRTEQQDGVEDGEIKSPVAEQLCESSEESENHEVEKDNNSQEQV